MVFAAGCRKFDDSAIWDKLNAHESRLNALEQLCSQMNTNISSLQQIVEALQNKDYVTNIAPITEDGKIIGYSITFSKSGSVTIYHGKDGKDGTNGVDGTTPVIGVKKHNGVYYWTIDGEWLLDDDGKKIKAEGRDGQDGDDGKNGVNGSNGKNGITPKLKIEEGYWYVSYDNGSTWTNLGKATSDSSNSGSSNEIITDVTYDDNCVYITLADGTELIVSRYITSQILYTATAKIAPAPAAFGVNIISNEWDATTGEGVLTFNGEVAAFGERAFEDEESLISLTIPESVNSIQYRAFANCKSLTNITIPDSVTSIGECAFEYCESLTNVTLSKSITKIAYCAFMGCAMEGITIPDSVTSIESGAFQNCTSLKSITIPNSVTEIAGDVFPGCTSLESITFPNGVNFVNGLLFSHCSSLKSFIIPDGFTSIDYDAFYNCTSLENITIPNSVTSILMNAFSGCTSLKGITLHSGIESIDDSAFSGCESLEEITIPAGVTSLSDAVFQGCISLTMIVIPENVEEIEFSAFKGCTSLAAVYCKPTTPPTLGEDAFEDTASDLKIYVPEDSANAYKNAAYWGSYAIIEETTNP